MSGLVKIPKIEISNSNKLCVIAGLNVLEDDQLTFKVAEKLKKITEAQGNSFIFKASFDKANRSSMHSFRGPGLDQGLKILAAVKDQYDVPVITDLHEPAQATEVAAVADVIQLPAFLSRQTDLVVAMAKTGAAINIKKAQFLAPLEMQHILTKCQEAGNDQLMLCERGSSFGYNNLVVDMLSFGIMKSFSYPVIFDVTHALQMPGGRSDSADGRRQQVVQLGKAGMSQGLAGLFLEAHPDPDKALCDGPCALPLKQLKPFLEQMQAVDDLAKRLPELDIR